MVTLAAEDAKESTKFRAVLGTVVGRAIHLEVMRKNDLDPDEAKLVTKIQNLLSATPLPNPADPTKPLDGPELNQDPVPTLNRLVAAFERVESVSSNVTDNMNYQQYRKLVESKSKEDFDKITNNTAKLAWINARNLLLNELAKQATGTDGSVDVVKFRNLIRRVVRRAIVLELTRIDGVLAVQGLLRSNAQGGTVRAGGSSRSSRTGKKKRKPCCLKLLFP